MGKSVLEAGVDVRRVIVKEKKRHRFLRGRKNRLYEEKSQELASDLCGNLRDMEMYVCKREFFLIAIVAIGSVYINVTV